MSNQQINEEASEWFIRMRHGDNDAATQAGLMVWLKRSPEHVSAYLDVAGIWTELKDVQVDIEMTMPARIAAARADGDVIALQESCRPQRRVGARTALRPMLMAASLLMAIGITLFVVLRHAAPKYSTTLGELRSIPLIDGSTVELNSQSTIKVRFGQSARTIELLQGQALFHVAKDARRPFIVTVADTSVRAVGTVFDVYRRKTDAVVTVVEGQVAVSSVWPSRSASARNPERSADAALLSAGKQLIVTPKARTLPKSVNVSAATAWTDRQLIFEFTPLSEVADEFNRYNPRRLVVESAALRDFKISAIFESTDPGSLVRFMRSMPEVFITESKDTIVIASAKRN